MVNNNGAYIGIGTNNPQYILDVDGTVRFNGTVNAMGINIVNKLQADTIKGVSMIDVNGTLNLTGGLLNEMFTNTGDLRLQSRAGYNGNILLGAGTTGNVGVGIFAPVYKLDVNGDARLNGKTHVYRLVPLAGDTAIYFGDSSIVMTPSLNNITGTVNGSVKGIGVGSAAFGFGFHSVALGTSVRVPQGTSYAIVIGKGISSAQYFQNTISNSLMIGFNSTIPTVFVGPSNGPGTTGKVGIGTSVPQAEFQVGEGATKVTVGPAFSIGNTFSTAYIGFNVARVNGFWNTDANGSNGGVVLLSEIGGGFRIIGVPSTGGSPQVLSDQQVADNTRLQVMPSGRVVIGPGGILPGSPFNDNQTMLTVNGRIMCKDAVVSLMDWPDYVFDSSYVLMPMDSLGQYVTAYKHLPGTPSAAQQEENGVSLVETCKQQQAQIEELTLYILQLNERLKALEAENAKTNKGGN